MSLLAPLSRSVQPLQLSTKDGTIDSPTSSPIVCPNKPTHGKHRQVETSILRMPHHHNILQRQAVKITLSASDKVRRQLVERTKQLHALETLSCFPS